jgi:carboxymethylenebutenolidase
MKTLLTLAAALLLAACQQPEDPNAAAVAVAAAQQQRDTPAQLAQVVPAVSVLEQELAYGEEQSRNLVGFLAMPGDATEPLPGVLVIHEWWGLNDDIKAITRRLAAEGYVALAVDLYGGAVTASPQQAQELMTGVLAEPDATRANLRQAYEYLEKYALAPAIGSIGWSLGGGWSLQTAVMLPEQLDAMVMYYGQVVTDPAQLEPLKMPLLGLFGALDQSIPVGDVQNFRQVLSQLGKNAQILIYPDVDHEFANPSDANYNAAAAAQAWEKTLGFLKESLKPQQTSRN